MYNQFLLQNCQNNFCDVEQPLITTYAMITTKGPINVAEKRATKFTLRELDIFEY